MKRIITIIIILAISLFCLTSCSEKTPTSVDEALNSLFAGDYKTIVISNGLDLFGPSSFTYKNYDDPEMVDKVIDILKDFKTHIEKEIEDYDSIKEGEYWGFGELILYVNSGSAKPDNVKWMGANGETIDKAYNYEISIDFINDKCQISVYDKGSRIPKASAYFKCDVDTSEYRESLNAIFEQETNAE